MSGGNNSTLGLLPTNVTEYYCIVNFFSRETFINIGLRRKFENYVIPVKHTHNQHVNSWIGMAYTGYMGSEATMYIYRNL